MQGEAQRNSGRRGGDEGRQERKREKKEKKKRETTRVSTKDRESGLNMEITYTALIDASFTVMSSNIIELILCSLVMRGEGYGLWDEVL
jgi:hypothetical protein